MLFKCPSCGIDLQVPDDRAGRRGRCKSCGSQVTAPAAAIGGTKSDGYVRVCDLLAEQSDQWADCLAYCCTHGSVWTASPNWMNRWARKRIPNASGVT